MNAPTQMNYAVNRENAIAASGNARISEKGKYVGQFTRAEYVVSDKGTIGIDFSFKGSDGATADYLTIWTQSKDGSEIFGRKVVDAMMTCVRAKTMEAKRARVEKYNAATKQKEMMDAYIYPELMGRDIGLLLYVEEYVKNNGNVGTKMVISGCFEADSGKTAQEIWLKEPATALPGLVASLRDKPLAGGAKPAARSSGGGNSQTPPSGGYDFDDQDISF
jgi:hypothetical protein